MKYFIKGLYRIIFCLPIALLLMAIEIVQMFGGSQGLGKDDLSQRFWDLTDIKI